MPPGIPDRHISRLGYDFLCIHLTNKIHRAEDVKHAAIKHAAIKHVPDVPICGVANFALVGDCPHLGCKQSLAVCAASVEAWYGIPHLPDLRRPVVDSSDGELSGLRNAAAMVGLGKPESARTMVVPSVFAPHFSHARRALPLAKARGPLLSSVSLPTGKSD